MSHIGSYLGLKQLNEAIRDPKKDPPNSTMPRFPLSPRQAQGISYFLKSRVKAPFFTTPMMMQSGKITLPDLTTSTHEKSFPTGDRMLDAKKCTACHKFKKKDGGIAPDLTYIGRMRKDQYIIDFISRPAWKIPGAIMPAIAMTRQETEFLVELITSTSKHNLSLPQGNAKKLYMVLCQRCHAAAGDGYGLIYPDLANFPRAFRNNSGFFKNIEDQRIVRSIEKGIPGTSMPPYGDLLSSAEIEDLVNLIYNSFIGIDRNDKIQTGNLPERPKTSASKDALDVFYRKKCSRCHGIEGTGTGKEYLDHQPQPRNLTNYPYFSHIPDERIARAILDGIPGTAMSSFKREVSSEVLWGLVEKIRIFSEKFNESIKNPDQARMAP